MSYSFSARGATKEAVLKAVSDQLDQVVAGQPAHARDRDAALAAVEAFVGLVPLPDGKSYVVSANGSVGWNADAPDVLTGAGVGVSVHLAPTEAD